MTTSTQAQNKLRPSGVPVDSSPEATLDERARAVIRHIVARTPIARNLAESFDEQPSLGLRAADAVARFGGSWTFVGLFAAVMLGWVGVNAVLLLSQGRTFDPYPYILLNLFLSMLAAIQAPVILMSQNRQAQKDRITAEHDYEVNLKAELEIMLLHEKIDALRDLQWAELIGLQQQQLKLLATLCAQNTAGDPGPQASTD
ncbi:MAG: DUF1003 domain-containing protein [Polaromonas sp.]|uniref:DUF1003 domain-containing protein n=1 Tax=Polaromonas sp. TaxID=1869339 RepID=UPI0032662A59